MYTVKRIDTTERNMKMSKKFLPRLYLFGSHYSDAVLDLFKGAKIIIFELKTPLIGISDEDKSVIDFAHEYYVSFDHVVIIEDFDVDSVPKEALDQLDYKGIRIGKMKDFAKLEEIKRLFVMLGNLEQHEYDYMEGLERILVNSEGVINREVFNMLNDANTDSCIARDFFNETIEDGLREVFKEKFAVV